MSHYSTIKIFTIMTTDIKIIIKLDPEVARQYATIDGAVSTIDLMDMALEEGIESVITTDYNIDDQDADLGTTQEDFLLYEGYDMLSQHASKILIPTIDLFSYDNIIFEKEDMYVSLMHSEECACTYCQEALAEYEDIQETNRSLAEDKSMWL